MTKIFALAALAVALVAAPASAETLFRAWMTHDQEVSNPPIPFEDSHGVTRFTLSDDGTSLSYEIKLFGLDIDGLQTPDNPNDNVTRVHIHAAPAGANGGIVYGMIDGSASLRNDLDDLVIDAGAGHITGIWDNAEGNNTTLAAQLAALNGGLYVNVHTSDHGGGEIRGQIVQIPEPSSIALAGMGALAGGFALWRKRRAARLAA